VIVLNAGKGASIRRMLRLVNPSGSFAVMHGAGVRRADRPRRPHDNIQTHFSYTRADVATRWYAAALRDIFKQLKRR
jgi:hypothetical protein